MEGPERVEVWPTEEGRWRWRYVGHVVLLSNMDYLSVEECEHSARTAYPDLPLKHLDGERPSQSGKPSRATRVFHRVYRLLRFGMLCYVLLQLLKRGLRSSRRI
ncbi:hypothetical protein [Sinosporangium siamense]|uniref:Uncharacterized protein n=1 Tax=Sinosporangium siamense TaxID=1367973 RepID=A0A919RJR6_9ACTN|nr:hypothetical protein [Sinosporangium siamense]GII94542.1 hypothetical protein Ssi02_47730 [Sinosporangium siamense]